MAENGWNFWNGDFWNSNLEFEFHTQNYEMDSPTWSICLYFKGLRNSAIFWQRKCQKQPFLVIFIFVAQFFGILGTFRIRISLNFILGLSKPLFRYFWLAKPAGLTPSIHSAIVCGHLGIPWTTLSVSFRFSRKSGNAEIFSFLKKVCFLLCPYWRALKRSNCKQWGHKK